MVIDKFTTKSLLRIFGINNTEIQVPKIKKLKRISGLSGFFFKNSSSPKAAKTQIEKQLIIKSLDGEDVEIKGMFNIKGIWEIRLFVASRIEKRSESLKKAAFLNLVVIKKEKAKKNGMIPI